MTFSRFSAVLRAPGLFLIIFWGNGENGATLTSGIRLIVCEKMSLCRAILSLVRSITLKGDRASPRCRCVLIEPIGSVIVGAALVVSDTSELEAECDLSLLMELNSSLISLRAVRLIDYPPVTGLVGPVCAVMLP